MSQKKKTYFDFQLENMEKDELLKMSEKVDSKLFGEVESEEESQIEHIGANPDEAKSFLDKWGKFHGLSSGIPGVDDLTYGFLPGELIIMAGLPGIGKSAFICNLAIGFAKQGVTSTIVSLELTSAQLKSRIGKAYGDGWTELPIYYQKYQFIQRKQLTGIVDKAEEVGTKVLIIDYLQMLKDETQDEHREIARIVRELKLLALERNILVIAISALNRKRDPSGELDMANLMGSGTIEFYGDMVLFLQRGEGHNHVIIKIVKNRNNPIDFDDNKRSLTFDGAKFTTPIMGGIPVDLGDSPFNKRGGN